MIVFTSISIGFTIILIALYMIRKEVMKASFFKHVQMNAINEESHDGLIEQMQKLETTVDEMNQSFYDISSDLEGKYSIHEKELSLLEDKITSLNKELNSMSELLGYQGKAIATFKPTEHVAQPVQNQGQKPVQKTEKPVPNDQNNLRNEILELRALGMDDQQIARHLGKGIREIKMLMNFIK